MSDRAPLQRVTMFVCLLCLTLLLASGLVGCGKQLPGPAAPDARVAADTSGLFQGQRPRGSSRVLLTGLDGSAYVEARTRDNAFVVEVEAKSGAQRTVLDARRDAGAGRPLSQPEFRSAY